jgi:hypothetical protein
MKCAYCNVKPIIKIVYETYNDYYCLQHLVDRLEYIRDTKSFNLLTDIIDIIPIFNL